MQVSVAIFTAAALAMMVIGMIRLDRKATSRFWLQLDDSVDYVDHMANNTEVLHSQLSSIYPLLDKVEAIIAKDVNFTALSASGEVRLRNCILP